MNSYNETIMRIPPIASSVTSLQPPSKSDINEEARKERKKNAFLATGLTSSLSTLGTSLLCNPAMRPAANILMLDSLMPAATYAIGKKYDDTPSSDMHRFIGNVARYGTNSIFCPMQQVFMHPAVSGKLNEEFQKHWTALCNKQHPLAKRFLGNVPALGALSRITAQMGVAYVGSDLQTKYHQSIVNAKVRETGDPGKFSSTAFLSALKKEKDFSLLFALPFLASLPMGQRYIMAAVKKKIPNAPAPLQTALTEFVTSSTLTAALVGLAQTGGKNGLKTEPVASSMVAETQRAFTKPNKTQDDKK